MVLVREVDDCRDSVPVRCTVMTLVIPAMENESCAVPSLLDPAVVAVALE